jgi:hypothetical protein
MSISNCSPLSPRPYAYIEHLDARLPGSEGFGHLELRQSLRRALVRANKKSTKVAAKIGPHDTLSFARRKDDLDRLAHAEPSAAINSFA